MLLVDTNVLIDVFEDDPDWADWSVAQLRAQSQLHQLAINGVVYAELSAAFDRIEEVDEAVDSLDLVVLEMPRAALFLAGKAFVRYRHGGGARARVLADFMIGAHAAVAGMPLLTRDAQRYRTSFPGLAVLAPH